MRKLKKMRTTRTMRTRTRKRFYISDPMCAFG